MIFGSLLRKIRSTLTNVMLSGRIHFSISYPDLDVRARTLIWRVFLKKALGNAKVEDTFSKADVDVLAEKILNGRQVCKLLSRFLRFVPNSSLDQTHGR